MRPTSRAHKPAGIDHMLSENAAFLGDHGPGAIGVRVQLAHHRMAVDLGTVQAGGLRKGMRGSVRVEVTFHRIVNAAAHLGDVYQRTQLPDLLRRHQSRVQAQHAMACRIRPQEIPACSGRRHIQAAREVQAHILAGQRLDLPVELDRVGLQPRHVRITVERMEPAGGMPARAGSQLLALAQHHVLPTELGQMVEHAAADNAPADDHDLCM